MKTLFPSTIALLASCAWLLSATPVLANLPGGGTGTGPDVTLTDNGNGTVTMANGIVSILITKSGATVNQINYTYNNGGGTVTNQVLAGGKNGGQLYWEFGGFGGNPFAYSVVANNGSYAEVSLFTGSATNGTVDVHFSMLRGSPGFYVTPIWSHRAQDGPQGTGEERDNIYIAPYFNWMSVDARHDRELGIGASSVPAFFSPKENALVTSGILQGTYDDKYKFSADFGVERVWGWSSVSDPAIGFAGKNIGIWHVLASAEFYNGGPLKSELMDAPMVNMINGGHYYMGTDSNFGNGEVWTRVSGPYFIYLNNVPGTLTDPVQTSRALLADAQAQAAAEQTAWPYSWMNNPNYAPAAQRGTVTGKFVINDAFNPNATASNLWVGVVQQPITIDNVYDFQQWMKPYQFWVKSDTNGNFTIPDVIAGNNYTLYAFGQGAAGTFMSKNQTGGNPPLLFNLPASQFAVAVTGGATNNLGTVTWTPTRVGPTVFEIGYPDRTSGKFRHGDDWYVGDLGPSPNSPSPIWTKFMEFPYDYPNGLNYVVGQNRWGTDWNFIQPPVIDLAGNENPSSSTITFNLASAPAGGSTASLLLGIASDDNGPLIVTVNGINLGSGVATGVPTTSLPTTGFFPSYSGSDANIREQNHAAYSDERLTFAGSLLHTGNNTINIAIRMAGGASFFNHAMYDYLRLEMTGYVPPAPASVTAYAGNNSVLLSWPVTPGATSYNILRSTTSGSGYVAVTNGVVGPVCGSGPANVTFVDNTAVNGTTCYYVVRAANPVNASGNSPQSSGVIPASSLSTSPPATPTGLAVASSNNAVTLNWTAAPGANFYTVYRGTVVNLLGYVTFYIVLSDTTTNTTYTDASGTLGCTYSYFVTATGAGGTSAASAAVIAKPVPPPPATPPGNVRLTDTLTSSNQTARITWSPVSGAVGYILYRATSPTGPFTFPNNYVMSMTTTNWTDGGLNTNALYAYMIVAMNAGGISGNSAIVSTPPAAPASLNAYPANAQIQLVWSAAAGATNYVIKRGTSSGNETTTVATTTNTAYTNTGLVNGTTYFYLVTASGSGGASLNSPEASATPFVGPPGIYWINALTASAQNWNVNSNWSNGAAFPNAAQATAIVNAPVGANQTINLNQAITVGALSLGAAGGAFNVAGNGGALTFDNTPGQASLVELSPSKGDTISAPVTLNSALNISNAAASPLTLSGTISGPNGVTYLGSGPVTLTASNSYTGSTLIQNATVNLANDIANQYAFGAGAITLDQGTLNMYDNRNTYNSASWNLVVPAGSTGTLNADSRCYLYGSLTGGGTLNFYPPYVRTELDGDWSGFTGQINVTGSDFRVNNTYGYGNAWLNLNGGVNAYSLNGAMTVGAISGSSGTLMSGTAWTVGARNTDATFAGTIAGNSVTKVGGGAWTLTGNNTYAGGTTISGGTLLVNNAAGSGTGSGAVAVNSGGTLAGGGIIAGAVTVNSGGAFAPGNPLGALTVSNDLTLAAGSATFMQVRPAPLTNDAVTISGTLTQGGTLNVTNLGGAPANGDSFKLFNAANYSGSFAGFVLPPLTGNLVWNTNALKNSGTLSVVVLTAPAIAGLQIVGGNLALNGSGGVNGWPYVILTATNLAAAQWTPVATNQFDAAGNFSAILTNAAAPGRSQLFFRLQLQ